MLKRIVSIFIVILLVLQMQFIQAENSGDTVSYAPYISSEAFLKALGIASEENDYTETVTRGRAASYIAAMLNEAEGYQGYRGIFSDVDSTNENVIAIEKLADLGIVRGDGNYAFRPNDYLTYNEATIMFMNALGYGLIGEKNTYREMAKIGLMNGVIAEYDVVNLGDLFIMMENALMENPITQTLYGATAEYQKSEQTLLYKVFDVVYSEGIIVKNDLTYLWTTSGNESSIKLEAGDGIIEIYSNKMDGIRDDLGKKVRVYYYLNKDTGKKEYVHHVMKNSNKILSIDFSQLEPARTDLATFKIAYYQPGKSDYTTVSLSKNYNIIYNNVTYKSNIVDFDELSNKVGTLELIDAASDGAYETLKIKAYDSLVVGNIYLSNNVIVDKYDINKKVDIDEKNYEKIFVYGVDGRKSELSAINLGSVISVAKSDTHNDRNVLEIHISDDIRNGKITKFNKNSVPSSIILDQNDQLNLYDRAFIDENGKKLSYTNNTNVLAYIDVFGNAVYVSEDKSRDMQYGIIVALALDGGNLAREAKVRIITSAGEIKEMNLAEKTIIDGTSCDPKKAYDTLSVIKTTGPTFTSGMTFSSDIIPVKYKENEDGTIKIIDTVKKGEGKNDSLEYVGGGTLVSLTGNVMGYQVPYTSDATVLEIASENLSNIDVFSEKHNVKAVAASTALKRANRYDIIAYKSNPEKPHADFVIKFSPSAFNYDSLFFVLDEIMEAYNTEEDESMYQLAGYVGGAYTEKWVSKDVNINALKLYNRGDILFVSVDSRNYISSYSEILVRKESGVVYTNGQSFHNALNMNAEQSLTSMCGYIKSVDGSLIKIKNYTFSPNPISSIKNVDWSSDVLYVSLDGASFTVIDDEKDMVYSGSAADILDYDTFVDDCSMVLIRVRSSSIKDVYIYNR